MKFIFSTTLLISFGLICSGETVDDDNKQDSNRQIRQLLRENPLRQRNPTPAVPSLYGQINVDYPGGPVAPVQTHHFSHKQAPIPVSRTVIHDINSVEPTLPPVREPIRIEESITSLPPLPAVRAPAASKILNSRRQHIAASPQPKQQLVDPDVEQDEEEYEDVIIEKRRRLPSGKQSSIDKEELRRFNEEQAKSAHYSFDSSIQDTINDHAISRTETRDGLVLSGMYSYSDGYFKRTVHYEADENGYRVTKEEIEPIGDGPQFNAKGKADVSSSLYGSYTITADDFIRDKKTKENNDRKLLDTRFNDE